MTAHQKERHPRAHTKVTVVPFGAGLYVCRSCWKCSSVPRVAFCSCIANATGDESRTIVEVSRAAIEALAIPGLMDRAERAFNTCAIQARSGLIMTKSRLAIAEQCDADAKVFAALAASLEGNPQHPENRK